MLRQRVTTKSGWEGTVDEPVEPGPGCNDYRRRGAGADIRWRALLPRSAVRGPANRARPDAAAEARPALVRHPAGHRPRPDLAQGRLPAAVPEAVPRGGHRRGRVPEPERLDPGPGSARAAGA